MHHDVHVGDFNVVGPRSILLGASRLGEATFVGAGAVILPRIAVGDGAVVGAGAVVVSDVPARARVAGVPARPFSERDD